MIEQETKTRIVVFVEYECHCAPAVSLLKSEKTSEPNVVALDPAAEYALEKMGQTYSTPDDYYGENELNELGIGNFARVEQFCVYTDKWLSARCETVGKSNLRPAWFSYFPLKILFDAVTIRLFILSAILKDKAPTEVWYFHPEKCGQFDHHLFFGESIYSHLIPLVCSMQNVSFRSIGEPNQDRSGLVAASGSSSRNPLAVLSRGLRTLRAITGTSGIYFAGLWRRLGIGKKGTVLILDLAEGEIKLVVRELIQESDYRLVSWRPGGNWLIELCPLKIVRLRGRIARKAQMRALADDMQVLWPQLWAEEEFQGFLVWGGMDFSSVVEARLRSVFTDLLAKAAEIYFEASALIARYQPSAVFLSQVALYWQHAVSAAAKAARIPVVAYQHGAFGDRISPMVYYTECAEPDYLMVYGDGVRQFLQRSYPVGAVPIAIGSPRLDQMAAMNGPSQRAIAAARLGLDPTKKTVVYCPSGVYGNRLYISYNYPKSDSQYFHIQRQIVQIFQEFSSVQFIIKEHPATPDRFPLREVVRDHDLRNCILYKNEIAFEELLPVADLFILDFPTTTLLEILAVGKQVLVFNNWYRWDEPSLALLKRATVFSDDLGEFCSIMRQCFADGLPEQSTLRGPSEFIKRFGMHSQDGRSGKRAAAAMQEIIFKHSHPLQSSQDARATAAS